jgi:hypothetical protein
MKSFLEKRFYSIRREPTSVTSLHDFFVMSEFSATFPVGLRFVNVNIVKIEIHGRMPLARSTGIGPCRWFGHRALWIEGFFEEFFDTAMKPRLTMAPGGVYVNGVGKACAELYASASHPGSQHGL